jgi:hypothetical protein
MVCPYFDSASRYLASGCILPLRADPDATEPNGFIYLAYVGAAVLANGLLLLGIGLIRNRQASPEAGRGAR